MKASLSELTLLQRLALTLYRRHYCSQHYTYRGWKGALKDDWLISTYNWKYQGQNCYLQQIRNQYGPVWLTALSEDEFTEEES